MCHAYTSDRSINVSAFRLDGRQCAADSQAGAGPARRRPCPAACTNEYARARFCALGVADDQITAYDPVSRPYAGPSRVPVLARLASLGWPPAEHACVLAGGAEPQDSVTPTRLAGGAEPQGGGALHHAAGIAG